MITSCGEDLINDTVETSPASGELLSDVLTARSTSTPQIPSNNHPEFTILGSTQPDPYEKSNMIAAINETYGTSYEDIPATHEIVQFTPQDYDQLALLDEWELDHGVPYFDIPFGYEVTQIGDRYIDPAVTDSLLTPRYASVPVTTPMPAVPYTVQWSIILLPVHAPATYTAFYRAGYTGDNINWDYDVYPGRRYYITDSLGYIIEQYPPDVTLPPPGGPTTGVGTGGPGTNPPTYVPPNCTPECENYPCCLEPLIDCGETECDPNIPCDPSHPYWPDCMDPYNPSGSDDPLDPRTGDPSYCDCTYQIVYPGQPLVFQTLRYELCEDETCGDLVARLSAENPNYINISCVSSNWTPPPPPTNECGCEIPTNPNTPAGCVQLETDLPDWEEVKGTAIRLKDYRFGRTRIYFTDEDGCWRSNRRYSNRVWMWNKFSNDNVKVRMALNDRWRQMVNITKDFIDRFDDPPYNNILVRYTGDGNALTDMRRFHAAATSLNAVWDYREWCLAEGVWLPRQRLNLTGNVVGNAGFGGGAPMLQGGPFLQMNDLFGAIGIPLAVPHISRLLPDVFMPRPRFQRLARYYSVCHHELGHASHFGVAGNSYWSKYREHVVSNDIWSGDPDGAVGNFAPNYPIPTVPFGSDPDRVALGEAWGEFTEDELIPDDRDDEQMWRSNYIPSGLFVDLIDDMPDDIVNLIDDEELMGESISGVTINQIFSAIVGSNSIDDFEAAIRPAVLSLPQNDPVVFDQLMDVYDALD